MPTRHTGVFSHHRNLSFYLPLYGLKLITIPVLAPFSHLSLIPSAPVLSVSAGNDVISGFCMLTSSVLSESTAMMTINRAGYCFSGRMAIYEFRSSSEE